MMTIRMKLIGLVCGVALVSILVQLFVFPRSEARSLDAALRSKARAVMQLTSVILAPDLGEGDLEKATWHLEQVLEEPDVLYARLFDPAGRSKLALGPRALLQEVTRPVKGREAKPSAPSPDLLEMGVTLPGPGDALWTLRLGFDRRGVSDGESRARLTAIVVGLGVLLLALLVGMLLGQGIARRLSHLVRETAAMAGGDLTGRAFKDKSDDEIGRLAASLEGLAETQRSLVRQITETAVQLNSAAGEFMATAQQQDRGATEQASAVEETRRTLDALIHSGQTIASSAQEVLQNAERTQKNSAVMADHISTLSEQVQRITEILEVIKTIANKSELLALNAALEGTKAGEAGRGFSLVAGEMQRLAENVMEAVRDIRELTGQIRESTQASVLATEESTKLSGGTTRSSRQIAMIIQQQQSGTEQVAAAMDDVSKIATQSAGSAREIVSSTTDILQLCERLQSLVGEFRVDDSDGGEV